MISKQQQWGIPLKNSGQFKTFFNISFNTGQICMGFEADTPQKRPQQRIFLLYVFAKSLNPDQDRQNVGPDLDPNCLTL